MHSSRATMGTGVRLSAVLTLGTHSVISELDGRLCNHTTGPKIFHYHKRLFFPSRKENRNVRLRRLCLAALLQVTGIPSSPSLFRSSSNGKCTKLNISPIPLGSQATYKQQQQTAATIGATAQTRRGCFQHRTYLSFKSDPPEPQSCIWCRLAGLLEVTQPNNQRTSCWHAHSVFKTAEI